MQSPLSSSDHPQKVPSLWALFITFARIGTFTFGGGYVILPLLEREMVERKRWIGREELFDRLSLSQSFPGIWVVNISIFVGFRVRGLPGALAATLGSILPSFVIILAIALFFSRLRENQWVEAFFRGVRPAVLALIAVPFIQMYRSLPHRWYNYVLVLLALLGIWLLAVSPSWIVLSVAGLSLLRTYLRLRRS